MTRALATSLRAGSRFPKLPRQRAGLSPWRSLLLVAKLRMLSIRPRHRLAVSAFVSQIGLSTSRMAGVSTSAIGVLPMIG